MVYNFLVRKTADILPAGFAPAPEARGTDFSPPEAGGRIPRRQWRKLRREARERARLAAKAPLAAEEKPPLLLHTCCAPCSTTAVERLEDRFDLRSFWFNPNIHPAKEYGRRLEENVRYADALAMPFEREETKVKHWFERMRGVERAPEGGERCVRCYEMRLERTADAAAERGIKHFASVMSVSPFKVTAEINRIGNRLAAERGLVFMDEDFGRNDGFQRSLELSDALGLYRQDYCGCVFQAQEVREKRERLARERDEARMAKHLPAAPEADHPERREAFYARPEAVRLVQSGRTLLPEDAPDSLPED